MPEESTSTIAATVRPTKKQRQILEYIAAFITEHGYSPSYREIMKGLNYTSVATVALHVNSLIKRGHLVKRDHSARSLEVVALEPEEKPLTTNYIKIAEEKWLVETVESRFTALEQKIHFEDSEVDALYVLVGALRVLGIDGAAQSFMPRLAALKQKQE
jgi:SOS-response transcriptional repressor LexA